MMLNPPILSVHPFIPAPQWVELTTNAPFAACECQGRPGTWGEMAGKCGENMAI